MPDTGWERYVFIHGLNLNKVAGILAAHRTDEIIGQGIGFQDITADSAAVPHGPAGIFLVGRRVWRRGTVFLYMIVGNRSFRMNRANVATSYRKRWQC